MFWCTRSLFTNRVLIVEVVGWAPSTILNILRNMNVIFVWIKVSASIVDILNISGYVGIS